MSEMGNVSSTPKIPGKEDPLFEQKIMLYMFGAFVVLPLSFIGTQFGYVYFSSNAVMAYLTGLSLVLLGCGFLGFMTVLANQAIKKIQIKLVQDN